MSCGRMRSGEEGAARSASRAGRSGSWAWDHDSSWTRMEELAWAWESRLDVTVGDKREEVVGKRLTVTEDALRFGGSGCGRREALIEWWDWKSEVRVWVKRPDMNVPERREEKEGREGVA